MRVARLAERLRQLGAFGEHPHVQNARNQDSGACFPIKDDLLSTLHPAQPPTDVIAAPTQCRIFGQHLAASLQICDVAHSLFHSPSLKSIAADTEQVSFRPAGEPKMKHASPRLGRKTERFANPRERIPFGHTAGVAFGDGHP